MLRVANVVEEGRYGGPQARIAAVAEKLKEKGIETVVVFPEKDTDVFYRKLAEKGIRTRRLSLHRLTRQTSHLVRYFVFFVPEVFSLFRLFRKGDFDLIHMNGSYQIKSAIAGKIAGVPVVWHLNDTSTLPAIKKAFVLAARYCADGFIVAGKRVYDYYIRGSVLDRKPFVEIHAPVNTDVFDPDAVERDERISSREGIKILTVANINPLKGLEFFIDMAHYLSLKYRNLSFFVGGAVYDSQKSYYESLIEQAESRNLSNVVFLGRLDDVASALKSADICVFASISEASPTSVWEAMAMGKAVVATDVGSVSQYVEDGRSGFIVPTRDAESLAGRVELLINDPVLRERMGREARAVARERLDVSVAAEKHARFYQAIVNGARMNSNGEKPPVRTGDATRSAVRGGGGGVDHD